MSEKKSKKTKVSSFALLSHFLSNETLSIPQIAKEMDLSLPTTGKLVNELLEKNYIYNVGKLEQGEGRPPMLFSINPEVGYFLGIDIKQNYIRIGLINFAGTIISIKNIPYNYRNTQQSLDELCSIINVFVRESKINTTLIINIQINISGRVNPVHGISHTMFSFLDDPISEVLEYKLGHPVTIENDTRSMFYGELYKRCIKDQKDVIYINLGWGLGSAIMINGSIVKGKSGFAGELGHFYAFENEILCHCGKKGCLETEVSGSAFCRICKEEILKGKQSILSEQVKKNPDSLTLDDILKAIENEDLLCIEIMEGIATKLGKELANLINLLNPELIIIGGSLSKTGDYLLLPLKVALKKYTLNLVNKGCKIMLSTLKDEAGIVGACYLARRNYLKELKEKYEQ